MVIQGPSSPGNDTVDEAVSSLASVVGDVKARRLNGQRLLKIFAWYCACEDRCERGAIIRVYETLNHSEEENHPKLNMRKLTDKK